MTIAALKALCSRIPWCEPAVRREVYALDKDLPVYALATLDEHVTATLTPQRLLAYLIGGFGALALLLATIGLYSLLTYTVTQRTPEIGIRMALGAHRTDVMRLFVGGAANFTQRHARRAQTRIEVID
jgi:putative ABC transport system permease protein